MRYYYYERHIMKMVYALLLSLFIVPMYGSEEPSAHLNPKEKKKDKKKQSEVRESTAHAIRDAIGAASWVYMEGNVPVHAIGAAFYYASTMANDPHKKK